MTPCKTKQEYINLIAEPARRVCKRYGFLPSILIAQSCLENGFGMAFDCYPLIAVNNMIGQKSELLNSSWVPEYSVWPGKSITKNTPEQYGNQIVRINDQFRVFDSIEQSLADYLLFLTYASNQGKGGTPKYGGEVLSLKDPATLIKAVASRGYATGQTYPTSVMRVWTENNLGIYDENMETVIPTDQIPPALQENKKMTTVSPLISYRNESPNNSGKRTMNVDRITPHCVVGQMSIESLLSWLAQPSAKASANYGIGNDGRIGLGLNETKRAWTSSSSANDQRAITVECASDKTAPYAFNDKVYESLVNLCVDICQRYGKTKLVWIPNKEQALSYTPASNEMLLTVHRWFANKECPGGWLMSKMDDLAEKVTKALGGSEEPVTPPTPSAGKLYRVQVGAFANKANAEKKLRQISATGTECFITGLQDGYYRVQCGAYSIEDNAIRKMNELQYMGFAAIVKEYDVA